MSLDNQVILVTGGTGSFGKKFVEVVLRDHKPDKIIIFSRDELKQFEMQQVFPSISGSAMRYFIGDVRDRNRLNRAFEGVDIVVHAAALKQVPACEYNPFEAINTNIIGTQNVVEAAIDHGIKKVLALSTDKAVNPINLYGATKLCAEKLVVQANSYSRIRKTRLSCVRYGNVIGSRGSVVPIFLEQRKKGVLSVTDMEMTRFWITLEGGVEFVVNCIDQMDGGEIFVPKIPSMKIADLAAAIAPGCKIDIIGTRPGEKRHEFLVSQDEARHTKDLGDMYIIDPISKSWESVDHPGAKPVPEGFSFASDSNDSWLSDEDLKRIVGIEKS
ncbi:MAG TPA: UDP-N-acetylglucosamine 4,6-dehydratase (inverting) [Rhodospirillales bacterium]|nr:UDP-N-acetylglucosamine 4,6-dehydratase (inverting) [Rhodospirillales bacterium]